MTKVRKTPADQHPLNAATGGVDAAAIIVSSTKVDTPFVMTLQAAGGSAATGLRRDDHEFHPNGASIDFGGCEKYFGPASVMWKQSSSRTPNLPGR